nr:MAG: putative transcription factor, eukaryotic MBF1 family [Candidatus Nanosalinarum sp. J07AB56]
MCGVDADLKTVKIEGSKLQACSTCAEMGQTVDTSQTQQSSGSSGTTSTSRSGRSRGKELAPNYGSRVKEAREQEQRSVAELADSLDEKSSLISKIEKGELKPDKPLGRKLERRLDVKLYVNPDTVAVGTQDTDDRKATIGDIADN